jgi:hypothetical protein
MGMVDNSHLNDPHRLEFEEYVYDNHRTAEELRHLLLKQWDEIQELKHNPAGTSQPSAVQTNQVA